MESNVSTTTDAETASKTVNINVSVDCARFLPKIREPNNSLTVAKTRLDIHFEDQQHSENEFIEGVEPKYDAAVSFTKEVDERFLSSIISGSSKVSITLWYKRTDESLVEYGTAELHIDSFIQGKTCIDEWVPVQVSDAVTDKVEERERAIIHIKCELDAPLLTEEEILYSSIMEIAVPSMHNLPTSWRVTDDSANFFEYIVSFTLPINETETHEFSINGGKFFCKQPKRENSPNPTEKPSKRANSPSTTKQDNASSAAAAALNSDDFYIAWPEPKRVFLSSAAFTKWEEAILKKQPLRIKFKRALKQGKETEDFTDPNENKYRGEVEIALETLLKQGVKVVEGRYQVSQDRDFVLSDADKKKAKGAPKKPTNKKQQTYPSLMPEPEESPHPFERDGTLLDITLRTSKAIIPNPSERVKPNVTVRDLIPEREKPLPKRRDAAELYESEILDIVNTISVEYSSIVKTERKTISKDKFVYELNTSGKYFAIKEKLKQSIVRIIKEKFNKTDDSSESLEKFYNDLYVYLVDHMHIALKTQRDRTRAEDVIRGIDGALTDKWKRLADEAEAMLQYETAATYHKQRISESPMDADVLYAYAAFCLRTNARQNAEATLREIIAVNMAHVRSLLAYGAILTDSSRYTEAEVYLQCAIDIEPASVLAWGMMAVLCECQQRSTQFNQMIYHANKLLDTETEHERLIEPSSVYANLIPFLIEHSACNLIDRVVAKIKERIDTTEETAEIDAQSMTMYTIKSLMLRNSYDKAEQMLSQLLETQPKLVAAWIALGHCQFMQGNTDAWLAYETATGISQEVNDVTVYLRLGHSYLAAAKYEDAKHAYLTAAKLWPCCTTWFGIGVSCYKLAQYEEAELALNEANIQNNGNAEVWGYLTLLCLQTNRHYEAEQAFREAIRLKLANETLLTEINNLQQQSSTQ